MNCNNFKKLFCLPNGMGIFLYKPTEPCNIVDCEGFSIVDCSGNTLSCGEDCNGSTTTTSSTSSTSSSTSSSTTTSTTTVFPTTTSSTTTVSPEEETVYTYNKTSWNNTDDFYISNGLDKTIPSNKLTFTTQGLVSQYAEMGEAVQRWHCYERTYDEFIWTLLSSPSSTNTGWKMRYGNTFNTFIGFNPFTGKIEARGTNNITIVSSGTLVASINDQLRMVINRIGLSITITVENLTTSQSISTSSFSYGIANVATDAIVPDTGGRRIVFASLSNGEIVQFTKISLGLKKALNVKVLCAGDSITAGYTCGTAANRWSQKLRANYVTEIAGGPGDGTAQCYVSCITLLPLIQPDYVLVGIGVNDGSGIPQPTYTNLVNYILSQGAIPVVFLMANDGRNQVSDWNWIQATFPSYVMVNPWNATLKAGSLTGEVNPLYKIDANHFNALGNDVIYNAIVASGKVV
jgi:lysophospholipase L1-like esterase